jgi:hypothetical protein
MHAWAHVESMGTREGTLTRAGVPCVAVGAGLHMSVLHPTCHTHAADARRRGVSHRAPALRPHRTDQLSMRIQRAHNREGILPTFAGPQTTWLRVCPRRALQFCISVWFGRPRRRWPTRRRPKLWRRSALPHWMHWVSVARDTHSCLIGYGLFTHTVRCVGRLRARARVGGGGDRVCDRIAVVVGNMTARLARPPHTHAHTRTHIRRHTHTHTVMD